ncbi:MAG: hypothetical protein JST22_01465 [Bacteroidetes bacterium]|nr:hypothetical protein [Bacteroidota bacterium]
MANWFRTLLSGVLRHEKRGLAIEKDRPLASRVPEAVAFRVPWHASEHSAHEELRGECGPRHLLHGLTARQVAARQDCDDCLFELFGGNAPAPFAVVHLTWGRHPDRHPAFPATVLFESFEDWVANCMIPDATEWEDRENSCIDAVDEPNE